MRGRLALFIVAVLVWAGALTARLHEVQIVRHEEYAARAQGQHFEDVELIPPRGTIFDSQGRKLAASVDVDSVYKPGRIDDPQVVARRISEVVGGDRRALASKLGSESWTWIARQLEPAVVEELKGLELPGIHFVKESKRFYPLQTLAGPLLGFVGVDHNGLAGLEAAYDGVVSGEPVLRTLLKDALDGRAAAPGESFVDGEPGEDLHLTIDAAVQYIVERELAQAIREHSAKAATAVLMDPFTGAILAMASLPSFDPNSFAEFSPDLWRNRAIQDAYEPGSTLKVITAAAALERNVLDPLDLLDCELGSITLGSTRIRDHKPFGVLTFRDVVAKSSNVGAIKAGLMVGPADLSRQLAAFGFGRRTGIDLPGESRGILRPVERWSKHEVAYASIGQGFSVTPLQLARAFAVIANGGRLVRPHVVSAVGERLVKAPTAAREQVVSTATNRTLLRLLEAVVQDGTGTQAGVPGYRIAGKTGTAQKVVGGRYAPDLYVASFGGFVPSRQPRIVGVVTVDEPRGRYHGGDVAAPVFGKIMKRVLPLIGVAPEESAGDDKVDGAAGGDLAVRERDSGSLQLADGRDEESPAGTLPSFSGLTVREALRLAGEVGVEIELSGSGFVRRQMPAAGSRLDSTETVLLHLEARRRG